MIALLLHNGRRVAIGEGADLTSRARELGLHGATVITTKGRLLSTCLPFNYEELASLDRHFGGSSPQAFEFNGVQCAGWK